MLLADLRRLFGVIHRRDEYASPENFQRALEEARRQLVWDATRRAPLSREAYNLQRFRENADSYFRFITEPNVEPTNNLAIRTRRQEEGRGSTGSPSTARTTCCDSGPGRAPGRPSTTTTNVSGSR